MSAAEEYLPMVNEVAAAAAAGQLDVDAGLLKHVRESVAYNQDKGDYWRRTDGGQFVKASEADLKRHLRRSGFEENPIKQKFTTFDNAFCFMQDHSAVSATFDLAGHKAGVFTTDAGRRVLVPTGTRLIHPLKGECGHWLRLHEQLFGEALPYVLSWCKVAFEDYYSLTPAHWRHHQCLCLVGAPNCGKSFWQLLQTRLFNAGEADPWPMLTGAQAFTKDLAEAPHWLMQDKPPFRNLAARALFAANLKTNLVTASLDVHAKGRDKVTLPTYRRLTLSTNWDADYLTTIPNLDDSIRDKLLIVGCGQAEMLPDFQDNLARFTKQRAAWLYYLLNEFEIPAHLADVRMGVKAWCSPKIAEALTEFDPVTRFLECIDNVFFGRAADQDPAPIVGLSAAEIQAVLCAHSEFGPIARQILPASNVTGQLLAKLLVSHPARVSDSWSQGRHRWTLHAP